MFEIQVHRSCNVGANGFRYWTRPGTDQANATNNAACPQRSPMVEAAFDSVAAQFSSDIVRMVKEPSARAGHTPRRSATVRVETESPSPRRTIRFSRSGP
jgi:hypothetical protein